MTKQFYFKQFTLALINRVTWFQVFWCITNNSITYQTFACTQFKWSTCSLWPIDGTLSCAQSGSGNNGKGGALHISYFPRKDLRYLIVCLVSWGCGIHRLRLCRRVRSPQWVSWMWHIIWYWGFCDARALGKARHPFIVIAPGSTWLEMAAPYKAQTMG